MTVGPFYAAVRQAAIVTSDERRGVDFTFGEGKVVLAAHGAEYGESHVELPIAYDGAGDGHYARSPLPQRFPPRASIPKQTITLELRDAESAAVCSTDDGYAYVIMPLARPTAVRMKDKGSRMKKAEGRAGAEVLARPAGRPPSALSPPPSALRKGPEAIGNILPELMARRGYARVQSAAQL